MHVLALSMCIREEFFMGSSSYVGLFTIFMVIVSYNHLTHCHSWASITPLGTDKLAISS